MQFVKITVDGVTYNLVQTGTGIWTVTNRAPLSAGDYLVTVTVTEDSGREITLSTDDENLLKALTLIVQNQNTAYGNRMLNYYPEVIKVIAEFRALTFAEGFEVDFLKSDIAFAVNDAYLTTMGLERIMEWEKLLMITPAPDESVEDRREVIIAQIRGSGKLNTALINSIVGTFTNGGTAESYIKDSVLYVLIQPPIGDKHYKFDNVVKALQPKIPAHIGLYVRRDYATWGEIKDNFANWTAVKSQENWEAVKLFRAPQ